MDDPLAAYGATVAAYDCRALLLSLRRDGPLTLDNLMGRLGLGRAAVLQQLRFLEQSGLVERRSVRHGVGRPRHLYDATSRAQAFLPAGYESLATAMLDAAREVGGAVLLARMFESRKRAQTRAIRGRFQARGLDGAPFVDQVRELAAIQDELGYVATIVDDEGGIRLSEHNCPILQIATRSASACEAEVALFAEVLNANVERESHIVGGSRCCVYRFEPRIWDATQYRPEMAEPALHQGGPTDAAHAPTWHGGQWARGGLIPPPGRPSQFAPPAPPSKPSKPASPPSPSSPSTSSDQRKR